MSHDVFVIALGCLVGLIGWLVKRVIDGFDAALKDLKERVDYLEKHLEGRPEDNFTRRLPLVPGDSRVGRT